MGNSGKAAEFLKVDDGLMISILYVVSIPIEIQSPVE
jgi:hypothetical protein